MLTEAQLIAISLEKPPDPEDPQYWKRLAKFQTRQMDAVMQSNHNVMGGIRDIVGDFLEGKTDKKSLDNLLFVLNDRLKRSSQILDLLTKVDAAIEAEVRQ